MAKLFATLHIFPLVYCLLQVAQAAERVDINDLINIDAGARTRRGDPLSGGLPKGTGLKELDSLVSAQGETRKKFQETYNDIPVMDAIIDVGQDTGVYNGQIWKNLDSDLEGKLNCVLSFDKAFEVAMAHFKIKSQKIIEYTMEDIIFVDDKDKGHNAIHVELFIIADNDKTKRLSAILDQCDSSVLQAFERYGLRGIDMRSAPATGAPPTGGGGDAVKASDACELKQTGGNGKKQFQYGGSPHCLRLRKSEDGKTCYLENEYVKVIDAKQTSNTDLPVAKFQCADGYKDAINGGFAPAYDSLYFGTKSITMYKDWYGYEPKLQNKRIYPKIYVHYNKDWENAAWSTNSMFLGDGVSTSYPWTTLDTIAHEMGHGVVEGSSDLVYQDQSGGMNEAFADMAGEAAEEYVFGKTDMLSGAESFKNEEALRWFDNPEKDGRSIKHVNKYEKGMDVHYSSGVYNHVFYQLAVVNKLKARYAFEVFVTANRMYWKSGENYETAACGVLRGAYDGGLDMDVVKASFAVTGVTGSKCSDLSALVTTALKSGETQNNLKVSGLRNPLFKIAVSGKTKLKVEVSGAKYAVSKSYKRSSAPLPVDSLGSVAVSDGVYYVRVFKDGDDEVTASVKATLS